MRERVISAAILVPVAVGVFLLGDPWLTAGLALLALLASVEVFRLLPRAGFATDPLPGVLVAPVAVVGMAMGPGEGWAAIFVAVTIVLMAMVAFGRPDVRDGFTSWLAGSFGALYASLLAFTTGIVAVAPPPASDPWLGEALDPGRTWLLVLVLTVWAFDTFAYLAGRMLGRGRFLNHISPSKTWSGVIGGSVAAVIAAGVLTTAAGHPWPAGVLMGLVLAVAAQAGDVAESMLKRTAGVKDSGALIPGHGGILDRVDSVLFAAPVVFAFLVVLRS